MTLDQTIDLARAALMEFGRPDLAELIYGDGVGARAPRVENTDDEWAYYKATELVQRSMGKEMICIDCWRRFYRGEVTSWPECDHR